MSMANTMLDRHADALKNRASSYHEFLTRYSKTRKVVYGFVEGKDDPCFYRGFIDYFLPDDWSVELWPAGNRTQVENIYSHANWSRFPKKRVCFFIDQDLSGLIPESLIADENIYVTDMYSIENSIVNSEMVKRILVEMFGFAGASHAEMDGLGLHFDRELERFLVLMIPFMAQILRWRRQRRRANLNDIDPGKLLRVDAGSVISDDSPEGIEAAREYMHLATKIEFDTSEVVSPEVSEYRTDFNYRKFVRGKYVLWFMIEFCISVHGNHSKFFSGYKRKPKMNVSISAKNAVTIIGNRARIPHSLRCFLSDNYGKYIQSRLGP